MSELYLNDFQRKAMSQDLKSIEDRLSSGSPSLDLGVLETRYTSPVLGEKDGILPYRDYLEFLAVHLRYCVETRRVPEGTLQILQAYKCPHLPPALSEQVVKRGRVVPLSGEIIN